MASFLRRNDDLRRLRARQMVLQYETGFYPTQDAVLRFVDAMGNIGESGVFIDDSGNLVVTGSADISGDLSVSGDTFLGGDLLVDGSGGFGGNLSVSGDTYLGGDLTIEGSLDLSGDLYVYGLVSASGDVISHSGRSLLSVNDVSQNVGVCKVYSVHPTDVGPQFQAYKSRDISGAVMGGDELGFVNFFGMDSSGAYNFADVSIRAYAMGDFTSTSHPAELRLAVCPSGGIAAVSRLVIKESGASQFLHSSTDPSSNYVERNFVDPSSGKTLYTRDFLVGQNPVDGRSYRDYRMVKLPSGDYPVWGIINDPSGGAGGDGSGGDIEFYNNVSVGVGSIIDANSAITIGGPTGRSMHRVFQDLSYNSLITHVGEGVGNVGYRLDSMFFNGSLKYGSNLLLNSNTVGIASSPGNVGIGTATPQATLDVSGSARVTDACGMSFDVAGTTVSFVNTQKTDTAVILENTASAGNHAALRVLSWGLNGENYIESGEDLSGGSATPLRLTGMYGSHPTMLLDMSNQRVRIGDDVMPQATLDVSGTFCLNPSQTPSSTADTSGVVGQITWGSSLGVDYIYVKTSTGWKRVALSMF